MTAYLRAFCLLASLWLAACASTTQITSRLQRSASPANSVLLAAITPEPHYRTVWENSCRTRLQQAGLEAHGSHLSLADWQGPNPQALIRQAQKQQLDAVLMVNLTRLLLMPAGQAINHDAALITHDAMPHQGNEWTISLGNNSASQTAATRILKVEAQLIGKDGKVGWAGLLRTHEANDLEAIADSQCDALLKLLTPAYLKARQ